MVLDIQAMAIIALLMIWSVGMLIVWASTMNRFMNAMRRSTTSKPELAVWYVLFVVFWPIWFISGCVTDAWEWVKSK